MPDPDTRDSEYRNIWVEGLRVHAESAHDDPSAFAEKTDACASSADCRREGAAMSCKENAKRAVETGRLGLSG